MTDRKAFAVGSLHQTFMFRLTTENLLALSSDRKGILLTVQQLSSTIHGLQLKKHVAELLIPYLLVGDDVRKFHVMYPALRDFVNNWGVNIKPHTSHRTVWQWANELYKDVKERELAEKLAVDIQKGRLSSSLGNNEIAKALKLEM